MGILNPVTFGLHKDGSEAALDPEWCALVSQQAPTLAVMLQHIHTTVEGVHRRTDARSLRALAADAERRSRRRLTSTSAWNASWGSSGRWSQRRAKRLRR
jgi:hypothetical protein